MANSINLLTQQKNAPHYVNVRPASILVRCLAAFIDFIIFVPTITIGAIYYADKHWVSYLFYLSPVIYIILPIISPWHATLGGKIMHIKIMSISGKNPKMSQILIRLLVLIISLIALFWPSMAILWVLDFLFNLELYIAIPWYLFGINCLLLFIPTFWSKSNLTLHDRISKTFVATIT